jgi:hypothetical protein
MKQNQDLKGSTEPKVITFRSMLMAVIVALTIDMIIVVSAVVVNPLVVSIKHDDVYPGKSRSGFVVLEPVPQRFSLPCFPNLHSTTEKR